MMRALLLSSLIAISAGGHAMAQTRAFPDDARLLDILKTTVDGGRATGLVLGVMEADGSTRVVAYGDAGAGAKPLSTDSVFEIGSVTKVFTTTLLADMAQKGEVQLAAPAQAYAPAGMTLPVRDGKQITLGHLAEQNSGLPRIPFNLNATSMANPYAAYTPELLNEFLGSYKLIRDPGAQFEYSNLGMGVLGALLANRAGQSYEELVQGRILKPLGMTMSGIALTPEMQAALAKGHGGDGKPAGNWDLPTLAGAGALRSNMTDMLKFLDANLGEPKNDLERAMRIAQTPRFRISDDSEIGLGWITVATKSGGKFVFHDGGTGGYGAIIGLDPRRGVGLVLLGNRTGIPEEVALHLFDPSIPLGPVKPDPVAGRKEVTVPAETLAKYAGVYAMDATPGFKLTVTVQGGQLYVQATGQDKYPVFPESQTKFFLKVVDAQVSFVTAADGKPAHLILHQGGMNQKATKVS